MVAISRSGVSGGRWLGLAALMFFIDQAIKVGGSQTIALYERILVASGFNWVHVLNLERGISVSRGCWRMADAMCIDSRLGRQRRTGSPLVARRFS